MNRTKTTHTNYSIVTHFRELREAALPYTVIWSPPDKRGAGPIIVSPYFYPCARDRRLERRISACLRPLEAWRAELAARRGQDSSGELADCAASSPWTYARYDDNSSDLVIRVPQRLNTTARRAWLAARRRIERVIREEQAERETEYWHFRTACESDISPTELVGLIKKQKE